MRTFLILSSLIFFLSSCKKEVFELNEDVSIGYNSTIRVATENAGNIDVKYTELVNESRCPPEATCVWPGFVEIQLKLNNEQHVELGLGESMVDSVVYNDHTIKLLAVEYDSEDDFSKEKKSSVVVRVY